MRGRFFYYAKLILILALTTSCQSTLSSPSAVNPSLQPVNINPTKPLPVFQVTYSAPYPAPNFEVTPTQSAPTLTVTPTVVSKQPTAVYIEPTPSILPQNTQSVSEYSPKCEFGEAFYFRCSDNILGIQYKYPSRWGIVTAHITSGSCGGYALSYEFGSNNPDVSAGGISKDFCKQIESGFFSFAGFEPGHGCDQYKDRFTQDCLQLNDNVIIVTLFPDIQSLCSPYSGSIFIPKMAIAINLPGDHTVAGLIFSIDFLSIKGKDKLFQPFGGVFLPDLKCGDPNIDRQFAQLVKDIVLKVKQNTFDEETSYKVKGIMDLANSITFTP